MGAGTAIEWTDATWNPVGGCEVLTPGCTNCYAMRLAASARLTNHPLYRGTTKLVNRVPVWNGKLTVADDYAAVWGWALGWRGAKHPKLGPGMPSTIFVGDMADLFHESRPRHQIDRVMIAGLRAPHILQVLTKRSDVLARYIQGFDFRRAIEACHTPPMILRDSHDSLLGKFGLRPRFSYERDCSRWPTPFLWLGFSAEDQRRFDARWADMRTLAAHGWIVFVSIEPMLGPVVLPRDFLGYGDGIWVICGGESGPDARPMHPDWARGLRDQCARAGVPFFFKQWGEWQISDWEDDSKDKLPFCLLTQDGRKYTDARAVRKTPAETEFSVMHRVGKKRAGRDLDGRTHDAFPRVRA